MHQAVTSEDINGGAGDPAAEEDRKIRFLRICVDLSLMCIYEQPLSPDEALDLMNGARRTAERLFPDSGRTFDLIYKPRFLRALRFKFGEKAPQG